MWTTLRTAPLLLLVALLSSSFALHAESLAPTEPTDSPLDCWQPQPEIAADHDPSLNWQWTIQADSFMPYYTGELRLYRATHGYRLVSIAFERSEAALMAGTDPNQVPFQLTRWYERSLHPAVAIALTQAITRNRDNYVATWTAENGQPRTDADVLALIATLDGSGVSFRDALGCASDASRSAGIETSLGWFPSAMLLSLHAAWRLEPVGGLLQAAAVYAIDSPTLPLVNDEIRFLFWSSVAKLYLLLLLPALVAGLVVLLPGRPTRPIRFVWHCTLTVYGLCSLLAALMSPFILYAYFVGGKQDFGGITTAAFLGQMALAGGSITWLTLSLVLPIVMRWRRWPRWHFT